MADVEPLCPSSVTSELRVCAGTSVVYGVDVSKYQGTVNWTRVAAAGKKFAITRVSDGTTYQDARFDANWVGIKNAGLIRGVYQFFRPGQDPTAQANLVINKLHAHGGLKPGDLPVVLDIEATDGMSPATIQARALTWLRRVEAGTGRKPMVYTANFMSSAIGTALHAYPLWVANYTTLCPLMPSGWSHWAMWQNSSTGTVSGISGHVDLDRYNGTLAQLRVFAHTPVPDAGAPHPDAGTPHPDAGTPRPDAGTPHPDAGIVRVDAGNSPPDAAARPDAASAPDAAEDAPDASVDDVDAGVIIAAPRDEGMAMGDGAKDQIATCGL
jgi:lysozyme